MTNQDDETIFSANPPSDVPDVEPEREFEDRTLLEALGMFWREPMPTLRALAAVARTPTFMPRYHAESPSIFAPPPYASAPRGRQRLPHAVRRGTEPVAADEEFAHEFPRSKALILVQLILRVGALALAVLGGLVMFNSPVRSEQTGLDVGAPYLLAGFLVWLLSELIPAIFERPPRHSTRIIAAREAIFVASPTRLLALFGGLITSVLAWMLNGGNMFTLLGVIAWAASILLWVWALAPEGWTPLVGLQTAWDWLRGTRIRISWTLVILIVIMGIGTYYRFVDLNGTPPEMTSDHVEKILDVNRVLHGETNVFFANNHGRDAIQFYALALMTYIPGLDLNFFLLKLLTVLEGLITLPVLWWMGREVIGKDEPRLGNAVGLALAALVAVSYWHEMLSRLGLRIVLTPLFVALVIIFLARAVRYNRRSDFIYAGLALGFGVYAYQAIRMLPVAVLFAVGIAFVFWLRSMRARGQMLMNFAALVIVSFVIFVPLFRYSVEYPEDFWRRTSGRLFGDDITETTDANGNLVMRTPTLAERLDAFNQNVPDLLDNMRNALLMYNWKGDVAWINNAPNHPAFDPLSGALLILGVAAWLTRMVRRRDAFDWSLLPLILIMMLPSALSIAYPIENPSATRISGTLPGVYLLAALPLALLALALPRVIGRIGAGLGVIGATALVVGSYGMNYQTYFQDYRAAYTANSLPYSVGGAALKRFAAENGYGNAFILAYPYWWDHRALGIDGGKVDWGNTITSLDDIPTFLQAATERSDDMHLDINKDMLFFYSPDDTQAQQWLQDNFPMGTWQTVTTYQPGHSFNLYLAKALGEDGFAQFLEKHGLQPAVG